MQIKPIRTKTDYRAALKEIETLMPARADTPEGERLDVLVTLVEAYEKKHYPFELPDPVEAIKFRMEQSGLAPRIQRRRAQPGVATGDSCRRARERQSPLPHTGSAGTQRRQRRRGRGGGRVGERLWRGSGAAEVGEAF